MKKMICMLCVIVLLGCGGSSAAAGSNFGNGMLAAGQYSAGNDKSWIDTSLTKKDQGKALKDAFEQKKQQQVQHQQYRQQVKLQLQAVKQNQKQVQVLKKTMNARNRDIQKELTTLRQKNSSISKDKLLVIKSKLQIVKEDREAINSINTDINVQLKLLKTGGKTLDLQGAQSTLENIVNMQQKQKAVFEKAISDLDELHKALL